MIWVNIDIPTKKFTIHKVNTCPYTLMKKETKHKGIDKIKDHGGWMSFNNVQQALDYHKATYGHFEIKNHC